MNFIDAIKICFTKYFIFSGRASRSEFWYFMIFAQLFIFVLLIIDIRLIKLIDLSFISFLLTLPSIAVSVRRLHDVNRSGWWLLLAPTGIGLLPLLYWSKKESDSGDNDYGSNPLKNK